MSDLTSLHIPRPPNSYYFFFAASPTPETYTLSLHDALPILSQLVSTFAEKDQTLLSIVDNFDAFTSTLSTRETQLGDRKSTRLNSSHRCISYAVFCLKKKNY